MTSTYVEIKSNKFPAGKKRPPLRLGQPKRYEGLCMFLVMDISARVWRWSKSQRLLSISRHAYMGWMANGFVGEGKHSSQDAAGRPHLFAAIQHVSTGVYLIITLPFEGTIAFVFPGVGTLSIALNIIGCFLVIAFNCHLFAARICAYNATCLSSVSTSPRLNWKRQIFLWQSAPRHDNEITLVLCTVWLCVYETTPTFGAVILFYKFIFVNKLYSVSKHSTAICRR